MHASATQSQWTTALHFEGCCQPARFLHCRKCQICTRAPKQHGDIALAQGAGLVTHLDPGVHTEGHGALSARHSERVGRHGCLALRSRKQPVSATVSCAIRYSTCTAVHSCICTSTGHHKLLVNMVYGPAQSSWRLLLSPRMLQDCCALSWRTVSCRVLPVAKSMNSSPARGFSARLPCNKQAAQSRQDAAAVRQQIAVPVHRQQYASAPWRQKGWV